MTNRNIAFSLTWNIVPKIEEALEKLHELNDKKDFIHYLIDLSFPIESGDMIPPNIEIAKRNNSVKLKALAEKYGSVYMKMPNVGISQNYSVFAAQMNLTDGDILFPIDADETPTDKNWIRSIGEIMRAQPKYGWVSLMLPEHRGIINDTNSRELTIEGHIVVEIVGNLNWAMGGLSGRLVKQLGEIPYPRDFSIYGGLESALISKMTPLGYTWAMAKDLGIIHDLQTDSVPLLRRWKNDCVVSRGKQVQFEQWLKRGVR